MLSENTMKKCDMDTFFTAKVSAGRYIRWSGLSGECLCERYFIIKKADYPKVYFLRIGIAEKKQDRITKKNGYYPLIFYGNCIKIDMVLQRAADFQKVYLLGQTSIGL